MGTKARVLADRRRDCARRGGRGHRSGRWGEGRSGHHRDEHHDRRHAPDHRAGVALQDDLRRRECVLRVRQRPGRRQRAQDQLHRQGRRVRPLEDGAAGAAARRERQGLRDLRQPRHRAGPRHLGLPEQQEGAAGLRRDRRLVLGLLPLQQVRGKKYPYTIGWQPDYPGESKQYGKYIAANYPNAKVGVLYQNDAFGKNYYAGLRVGLGAKKSNIVDAESYDVATQANLTQQILSMRSKSADILVIFATPSPTITALVTATKVGWTRAGDVHRQRVEQPHLHARRGCERRRPDERVRDDVRQELDRRQGRPGVRRSRERSSTSTPRRCGQASTAATPTSSTGSRRRGTSSMR